MSTRTPAVAEFTGQTLDTRGGPAIDGRCQGSAARLRLKHEPLTRHPSERSHGSARRAVACQGEVFPRESRADAGQAAHYMLRWLSTRGEAGPWSETASATIGA